MVKGWLAELDESVRRDVTAVILIGMAGLSYFALFSANPGAVGGFIQRVLQALLGRYGAVVIPSIMGVTGVLLLTARTTQFLNRPRIIGLVLSVVVFLSVLHRNVPGDPVWAYVRNGWLHQLGGGAVGGLLTAAMVGAFGQAGRDLLLLTMSVVAIPLVINMPLRDLAAGLLQRLVRFVAGTFRGLRDFVVEEVPEQEEPSPPQKDAQPGPQPHGPVAPASPRFSEEYDDDASAATLALEGPPVLHLPPAVTQPEGDLNGRGMSSNGSVSYNGSSSPALEINRPVSAGSGGGSPYRFPPVTLLQRGPVPKQGKSLRQAQAKAAQLEQTLASFGVQVKVVGIQEGPAVTRYELEPAVGVRVSKIQNLASDIALNMAAPDIRIEAPIPGKSLIGIEVPNRHISPVYLRDVLDQPEFRENPSLLTIALGKDIAGQPVITSLERMVHVLVAGATGSGKSVCINAFLASLLFKATPQELRLLLIDPKMVELSGYNGIPHLLVPVVTDPKKAASSLQWLVREMGRRYRLFADASVRDIARYNAQAQRLGEDRLPYIVVVIDELADLMMVSPVDVEDAIQRLAQMARAAGIHLVVATQRPSVDVITGVIKANIPSRIAFAVSSQADSRVILDMAGAEKLVGKGDMLFSPMGSSKPIRVQGVYVSESELEALLNFVRNQAQPTYDAEVLQAAEQPETDTSADEEDDELFVEALRLVVEAGQASVSMLQRRLRIGYTRAGRLVDMMEQRGFVGPYQGSKAREVLITMEEFRRLYE